MEIYKTIRAMRLNSFSQRQIAETLHISSNTMKKYWDGDQVPWERKAYPRREMPVCTEEVCDFIYAGVVSRVMRKFALVSGRNLLQGAA